MREKCRFLDFAMVICGFNRSVKGCGSATVIRAAAKRKTKECCESFLAAETERPKIKNSEPLEYMNIGMKMFTIRIEQRRDYPKVR